MLLSLSDIIISTLFCTVPAVYVSIFVYADDIGLLATPVGSLQTLLTLLSIHADRQGVNIYCLLFCVYVCLFVCSYGFLCRG